MIRKMSFWWIFWVFAGGQWSLSWAESPAEPGVEPQPSPSETFRRKGKIKRGTEAEGTQAPNRFDNSEFTLKSKYKLDNGESLEVDTD